MRRDYVAVAPDETLEQLVGEHVLGGGRRSLMVEQDGRVVGLLTLHHIRAIPRSDWATTTARQVMIPLQEVKQVRPDAELTDALEEMDRDGVNQLPVMVDGQIQGMLGRDDVISFLRTAEELGA